MVSVKTVVSEPLVDVVVKVPVRRRVFTGGTTPPDEGTEAAADGEPVGAVEGPLAVLPPIAVELAVSEIEVDSLTKLLLEPEMMVELAGDVLLGAMTLPPPVAVALNVPILEVTTTILVIVTSVSEGTSTVSPPVPVDVAVVELVTTVIEV